MIFTGHRRIVINLILPLHRQIFMIKKKRLELCTWNRINVYLPAQTSFFLFCLCGKRTTYFTLRHCLLNFLKELLVKLLNSQIRAYTTRHIAFSPLALTWMEQSRGVFLGFYWNSKQGLCEGIMWYPNKKTDGPNIFEDSFSILLSCTKYPTESQMLTGI